MQDEYRVDMDEEQEFWRMVTSEEMLAARRKRAASKMAWMIVLQLALVIVFFAAMAGAEQWVIVGILLTIFTVERRCALLEQHVRELEEAFDDADDDDD